MLRPAYFRRYREACITVHNREAALSDNISDIYLGDARFESRLGYRQSQLGILVIFLSPSRIALGVYF